MYLESVKYLPHFALHVVLSWIHFAPKPHLTSAHLSGQLAVCINKKVNKKVIKTSTLLERL